MIFYKNRLTEKVKKKKSEVLGKMPDITTTGWYREEELPSERLKSHTVEMPMKTEFIWETLPLNIFYFILRFTRFVWVLSLVLLCYFFYFMYCLFFDKHPFNKLHVLKISITKFCAITTSTLLIYIRYYLLTLGKGKKRKQLVNSDNTR